MRKLFVVFCSLCYPLLTLPTQLWSLLQAARLGAPNLDEVGCDSKAVASRCSSVYWRTRGYSFCFSRRFATHLTRP